MGGAGKPQAKDAFAGCKPQRVHCTWLSERDKQSARSAEIIRLVVDEERGDCGPWVNADYQESFLKNVQEFIGPTSAVLATYAGTITAPIDPPDPTLDSLRSGLGALQAALRRVHVGRGEMLLGMDGCVPGETTRLQTVVHLRGEPDVSLSNTTVKLYPTSEERPSLLGWQLCEASGHVPDELVVTRRMQTAVGTVLVLVCNDAALFSARSQANLRGGLGLAIRQHFLEQAQTEPRPAYVLMATHWQGTNPDTGRWSGEAFRQASEYLADKTGATVVITLRAPSTQLEAAASRFRVLGPRENKVATLLVRDGPPS